MTSSPPGSGTSRSPRTWNAVWATSNAAARMRTPCTRSSADTRAPSCRRRRQRESRASARAAGRLESYGRCPPLRWERRKRARRGRARPTATRSRPTGTWKRTDGCGYRVFLTIAGKTLTDAQVRKVLGGQAVLVKGFTSKSGKSSTPGWSPTRNVASRSISANDRKHVDAVHRSSIRNMIGLTMWMGTGRMQSWLECRKTPLPKKGRGVFQKVIRDEQSKGGRVRPQIRKGC